MPQAQYIMRDLTLHMSAISRMGPRDYKEDYYHVGGMFTANCTVCHLYFTCKKLRGVCKTCTPKEINA